MNGTLLLVEDDDEIAFIVSEIITGLGRAVERVSDGFTALERLKSGTYEVIVLDIGLPSLSGLEVCKAIRKEDGLVPVLMLTSRAEEIDKVLGLELGADDYLTKPFSVRELGARLGALLRRAERLKEIKANSGPEATANTASFTIGALRIDFNRLEAFCNDSKLALTSLEFNLLAHLASNPGRSFSRSELMEAVWGYHSVEAEGTVTAHLCRLRQKIQPSADSPRYIITVRDYGYRFTTAEEVAAPTMEPLN